MEIGSECARVAVDPFRDGKLVDKGCGAKKADKTFGDPFRVDVVDKAPH